MPQRFIRTTPETLTLEQLSDLLDESTIHDTLDLGNALLHRAIHPQRGAIILVATAGERHALLPV